MLGAWLTCNRHVTCVVVVQYIESGQNDVTADAGGVAHKGVIVYAVLMMLRPLAVD